MNEQKQSMLKKIEALYTKKEDFLNHIQKKNGTSHDSVLLFIDEYEDAMVKILHELLLETLNQTTTNEQLIQLLKLLQKQKYSQKHNYN